MRSLYLYLLFDQFISFFSTEMDFLDSLSDECFSINYHSSINNNIRYPNELPFFYVYLISCIGFEFFYMFSESPFLYHISWYYFYFRIEILIEIPDIAFELQVEIPDIAFELQIEISDISFDLKIIIAIIVGFLIVHQL